MCHGNGIRCACVAQLFHGEQLPFDGGHRFVGRFNANPKALTPHSKTSMSREPTPSHSPAGASAIRARYRGRRSDLRASTPRTGEELSPRRRRADRARRPPRRRARWPVVLTPRSRSVAATVATEVARPTARNRDAVSGRLRRGADDDGHALEESEPRRRAVGVGRGERQRPCTHRADVVLGHAAGGSGPGASERRRSGSGEI